MSKDFKLVTRTSDGKEWVEMHHTQSAAYKFMNLYIKTGFSISAFDKLESDVPENTLRIAYPASSVICCIVEKVQQVYTEETDEETSDEDPTEE